MDKVYKKFKISFYYDEEHKQYCTSAYIYSTDTTETKLFTKAVCETYHLHSVIQQLEFIKNQKRA